MAPKTVEKDCIEQAHLGEFHQVHTHLSSLKKPLDQESALDLIIACCGACYTNLNTPANLDEGALVRLLQLLLTFITTPLTKHCDKYLQSVFHIVKFLVEKRAVEAVLQLEELLMPKFMPLVFTEKQTQMHQSVRKLLYNLVVRTSHTQPRKGALVPLCILLYTFGRKGGQSVDQLLEMGHNCLLILVSVKTSTEDILKFYTHSLSLEREEPSYHLVIDNFSLLYTHLLTVGKFEQAETCYISTVTRLRQTFKGKEYTLLEEVLKVVRWLNPISDSESTEVPTLSHAALKTYHHHQYKSVQRLGAVCQVISSVASVTAQHYKTHPDKWMENPIEVHLQMGRLLYDISLILSRIPHQCHCKSCPTQTNLNEALRVLDSLSTLGRLYISQTTASRPFKMDLLRHLDTYTELVCTLHHNKCPRWRTYWHNAGVHLYLTGFRLHGQHQDLDVAILFLTKFVQVLARLEGVLAPEVLSKSHLVSALVVISDCHLEAKEYEKCLVAVACAVAVGGGGGSEAINRWIRAKGAARDSTILGDGGEVQELTLVSVCERYRSEVDRYFPNNTLHLTREQQQELLIFELTSYKNHWKSKVPMMATYRHLTQLADSTTSARVFVEVWGQCDLLVHPHLPTLLRNTVKRLEKDTTLTSSTEVKYYLAHMYFLQHKYCLKEAMVKRIDLTTETIIMDRGEIIDSSASFNYHHLLVKALNKALTLVVELCSRLDQVPTLEVLFKLLMLMGHEFHLQSATAKAVQVFTLALNVARVEGDQRHLLEAGSFLVELSDVTREAVRELVREVDAVAAAFVTQQRHLEAVVVYYVCKAEAFLYEDFATAYRTFRKISLLREGICSSSNSNDILTARIYLLHHKLIRLPCEFGVEGHEEYSMVRIHQAYNHCIKHYKQWMSDSSYDMRIFFDVCEELVKMYHDMRLPREVRCYGQEVALVAQKLMLPLRTAALLYYLANADLSSCLYDECKVKLDSISDILSSNPDPIHGGGDGGPPVEQLFSEMTLTVPSSHVLTGSPSFVEKAFHLPAFLKHTKGCECFHCTSVEYQQHLLRKLCLQALLYEYQGNQVRAEDLLRGSIKVYQYCTQRRAMPPQVPVGGCQLAEIHCTALLHLGNLLLRADKLQEADTLNRDLVRSLEAFRLRCMHLYNEALAQRLDICMISHHPSPQMEELTAPAVLNTAVIIFNTPELKRSEVVVIPPEPVDVDAVVDVVKVPRPKLLTFELSDDDEEEEVVVKSKVVSVVTSTPAPGRDRARVESKSTAKKKSARVLDLLPGPEGGTPGGHLATRTKLLTEKLKSSNRKREKVDVGEEEKGRKARQNLLEQLEGAESGTVRRSGRNKK